MSRSRRRAAAAALAIGAGALLVGLASTRPEVPSFDDVRAAHRPSDVPLLDRGGTVIGDLRTDRRLRRLAWTALADVSPTLIRAVLTAEDRRFRAHRGVDVQALLGAALGRLTGRPARGASTLTMQLVAAFDPTLAARRGGRSLGQKWRQLRAALALERAWSKDEILEAYLNRVGFRGEVAGVAAASAVLFGKLPHGLGSAEAVVLAALLRNPNADSPIVARRARVLADAGGDAIDDEALAAAVARLDGRARRGGDAELAPHLAHRLLQGRTAALVSTLDAGLQRVARDGLRRVLTVLHEQHVEDGAVLVADNASGDVLAYVGGSGARSRARFVDTVRARRQPGSTLKPFLYGLAFERRLLTPASLVEDTPLALAVGGGLYRPRDYDAQFRGLVSARTALAASLNVPAVRTLGLTGGDAFVATLRALGFEGLTEEGDYYGPALALGGADVTLWELVGAYRTLANGGVWSPLQLSPETRDATPPRRIFSAATAFLIADVLTDREARSTTFGLESALATAFFSAVKTGTSKEMRDNWCVGFSERYTVGVWVGNASGAPMHDVSGVAGAAPVWLEVMTALHRRGDSTAPLAPAGVVAATAAFPGDVEPVRREWFLAGTEPGTRALASGDPTILAPVSGTIVALDPDIPDERQRVPLESAGATPGLRWRIDDADLGPAHGVTLWEPTRGTHTVALVDAAARILDTAIVEVRGGRR